MEINYYNEDCELQLENEEKISNWIEATITEEGKIGTDINVIFCSDDYLLEMNKQYLQHDYYTDIITFDYNDDQEEEDMVAGDLFISIDTVRNNAEEYKVSFIEELHRIIIHGILHIVGYKDKEGDEPIIMRGKEDYYLTKLV